MTVGDWLGRLLCAAITFGVAWLRLWAYTPENSLAGAAICNCLSALSNACAVIAAAYLVKGKASFDLQRLAYCAVVVNLLGFLAYAAKSSPSVYATNTAITVISYAQLIRLLWPSNGDIIHPDRCRRFLLGAPLSVKGFHMEKEK